MDARLAYSRDELMASHSYAAPHAAAGRRLHGGFNAAGAYVSPRTLVRWPAVRAWSAALEARGWPLIDSSRALLARDSYPNLAQHKLLLEAGLGRNLWDSLTITGVIEARGGRLCEMTPPNLQALIEDDLSNTATGHLAEGLLYAHGADEGGDPQRPDEGAHDAMWFAARDLAFGKDRWPLAEAPASIAREVEAREMPDLPEPVERFVAFLMNVLMIEIGAERFFALCRAIFSDPELFDGRRAEAEEAAVIVSRIAADEEVHVAYLRCVISEMRSFLWKTQRGTIQGAEIVDPVWARMVDWHGNTERELSARRFRTDLEPRVLQALGPKAGGDLLARFDAAAT
ncbi:MAG TPA: hypothetical protein VGS12_02270 [Caulobacteraceae bacterium]|nr:hypothetical protein [Caulobacteraceae bacterium]